MHVLEKLEKRTYTEKKQCQKCHSLGLREDRQLSQNACFGVKEHIREAANIVQILPAVKTH